MIEKGITKRQLGYLFIFAGAAGIAGPFLADLIGAGQFQGVGPTQRLVVLAAAALLVIGLTLLPLGDRPA